MTARTKAEPAPAEEREAFDAASRFITIKARGGDKRYFPVQARIDLLRHEAPDSAIDQELVQVTEQYAIFKTTVTRIIDGEVRGRADGYGHEFAKDFPDYVLKAATVAIGRALNALGYGGSDLDEGIADGNVADAPNDGRLQPTPINFDRRPPSSANSDPRAVAARHLFATIREVYGKSQPISDIGHNLVCTRYALDSTKDATEEQLRAVADAVEAWSYEQAVKAWEHIRLIAGAETETMLVDVGAHFDEIGVSSLFVRHALAEQLRRIEEKRTTAAPSMAETDALVAAATVGVDGP